MSGYPKPNYTQIPNALFDHHLPDMKEAELKVVLAIARATFGWHKVSDKLSLSQLMEMTGMHRQGVVNGIKDGMERGVILREANGMGYLYSLCIEDEVVHETDYRKDKPVHETDQSTKQTSPQSIPKLVHETDQLAPKLVHETDTQKKVIKERKKNDDDDPSSATKNHHHPTSLIEQPIEVSSTKTNSAQSSETAFVRIRNVLEENEFGRVTGIMAAQVNALLKDYTAAWIDDAIGICVEKNVRNLKYLTTILANWKKDGRNGKPKPPVATKTVFDVPDYIKRIQAGESPPC